MLSCSPELLNGVISSERSAHVTGVCNESAISGHPSGTGAEITEPPGLEILIIHPYRYAGDCVGLRQLSTLRATVPPAHLLRMRAH